MNARAITYRHLHNIPEGWGTAVNIQAMVFGNLGNASATGVAFTRNPSTGEKSLYGEFLVNAQGEDVVAGIRTPQSITEEARIDSGSDKPSMEKLMPDAFKEFSLICNRLEAHYRDMQDIEFTIERGTLWMLQTRSGKRSTRAAMKIAVDMVDEKLITEEEAVLRIDPSSLDQLLHPTIDPRVPREVIGTGLPASPGAATGRDRLHRRRGGDSRGGGAQGHPPARRDQPGGHSRHARRRRHPDDPWRHDEPCGRRCPRHGHSLRRRCRHHARSTCATSA
jgi:pyruvate,orthophosphate dikinase